MLWSETGVLYVERHVAGYSQMTKTLGAAFAVACVSCAHQATQAPRREGTIECFEAAASRGYSWPFFLFVPTGADREQLMTAPLLVMPNNDGLVDDDDGVHRAAALKQVFAWRNFAQKLNVALLVPTFPRPRSQWQRYTHALDRDTLTVDAGPLHRVDLQLLAMIEDAQRHLGARVGAPAMLFGFSAAGMFANRFALLHPTRVVAAAIGSPGGWPMAPTTEFKGEQLRYPLGAADLTELVGGPLDVVAARQMQLFIFMGDHDTNDSLPFRDGYELADEQLAMRAFGPTPLSRWPAAQELYRQAQLQADFRLYPGIDHDVSPQMENDVIAFFERVRLQTR